MPFRTALSGLNATSAELRVIGNNVANAGTTGFKKSRTQFADIYASNGLGSSQNAIGSGVRVSGVEQQFSQGNIAFTDNYLDLAISGDGFFRLSENGTNYYSRDGSFGIDRDGYITNASKQRLTGYVADSNGNITGALDDIRLDSSDIAPQATSLVGLALNLDAAAEVPSAALPTDTLTLGSVGANPVLDTADSPIAGPAMTLVDGYGQQVTGAQLQFTHVAGNDWTVTLNGAGGTATSPTFTLGTTASATIDWDPDGAAGAQPSQSLSIDLTSLTPVTTGGATDLTVAANGAVQGGFNPSDATTYNHSTSLSIYDSLGASHLATLYYRKTDVPSQWESYLYVDGTQIPGTQANGSDLLSFTPTGKLTRINGALTPPSTITVSGFSPGGGAAPLNFDLDMASVSQFGGGFDVNSLSQDGYTTGKLTGVDIDNTGVVQARFSNGQSRTLAQIALAKFANAQGLNQQGDNAWAESFASGPPVVGQPGSSSLGLVESGALEGSNVDLTEQLVNMITAQRNFQANAQVISTADTVTQSIINLR